MNKLKKPGGGLWRKASLAFSILSTALLQSIPVYASVQEVTAPIDNLKIFIISVISGIGVIILAFSVWNWAMAYQQHDNATMGQALKGIVGGLVMAAIGGVMTFLGY